MAAVDNRYFAMLNGLSDEVTMAMDDSTPADDPMTPPDDSDPFDDEGPVDDLLQDLDDADPDAVDRPAFPDERSNEERGNRGPNDEPGFGQGA